MKVLIAEDDPVSRTYMHDAIASQGHEVHAAENGLVGLEMYNRIKPDLVISDIQMPKMDGLALLKEIRKTGGNTIVVMATAFGCEEYAIEALRWQANNYLKKPIDLKELIDLLKKYDALVEKPIEPDLHITTEELVLETSAPTAETPAAEQRWKFKSDPSNIGDIINTITKGIEKTLGMKGKMDARLGLEELVKNAILHGNLKGNPAPSAEAKETPIVVHSRQEGDSFEWVILDQGGGFDFEKKLKQYQGTPNLPFQCKGLFISQFHLDEIYFEDPGNIVHALKAAKPK